MRNKMGLNEWLAVISSLAVVVIIVFFSFKTSPVVHCKIGNEAMTDEQLAQNFSTVYNQLIHSLPNGEANVKAAFLKLTMGKPVSLLAKQSEGKSQKPEGAK